MNVNTLTGLLQFAVALIALVILHEFGHFVAARLLKVEVEEFGLGFPPRALTLFKAWGTKFTLNWIPLGGFVRPKGENDPTVPGGLAAANPWVRLTVFLAGPMMNILLGFFLYAVIFYQIGTPDPKRVQVVGIAENSPAAVAGMLPGDEIAQVNEVKIDSQQKLHDTIYANLDKPIQVIYKRGEETNTVSLTPRSDPPEGEGAIGIVMGSPSVPTSWPMAFIAGGSAVYQHSMALFQLPFQMLQGTSNPAEGRLVGFKGMFDIYQDARQGDIPLGIPRNVAVLFFFTNITISLGLINLMPFPALDGGRILFVLPEILFRRRIPPEFENVVNLVGFAILILLMLFINLQEFI